MMIRVAAAAYPLDWFDDWAGYEVKMTEWVGKAADQGAQILVFPEYGAMELASVAGVAADDLDAATRAVSDLLPRAADFLSGLAQGHGVHIVAPSGPLMTDAGLVNRAMFLAPSGAQGHQDKQIMTPWEVDPWQVTGNGPLQIFDTTLGRIGILICYDCEFPMLARRLVEEQVDIILIPSATETVAGYSRVRIGAMARALEGQCFTVMSSIVGDYPIEAVNISHGAGGVFCPPDKGLPQTGVIASGDLDVPGWTFGDLDLEKLATVRAGGGVRTRADWPLQMDRPVRHQPLT